MRFKRRPIVRVLLRTLFMRGVRVHQDRIAAAGRPLDGIRRRRGNPSRHRRLQGLRQNFDIVKGMKTTIVVQRFLAPCLQDDFHVFPEPRIGFVAADAEYFHFLAVETATRAPVHAATGEVVQQRHFFRQAQRMVEGGQADAGTDAQVFGGIRDVHAHEVNGRADAVGGEMMFRQPDGIVASTIHDLHAVEGAAVNGGERHAAAGPAKELQYGELHLLVPRRRRIGSANALAIINPRV